MARDSSALKSFLERTPFFGGLDESAFEAVAGMLVERALPQGEVVYREGDIGRSMYLIGSGEIAMYRRGASGLQVKLFRLSAGDFFGETTLIEMQPCPFTAFVEAATVLYELSNAELYRLYRENTKAYILVLQNINRELCRRLRKADLRITQLADEAGDDSTQISAAPPRNERR